MQKKFFVFLVALVWSIALVGASVTLDSLEISVQGGGYPRQGSTIVITMYYRVADIPEGESIYVYGIATGAVDQAQIKWYPSSNGTGTASNQNVSVNQVANTIPYDEDGNGYQSSHTATFTLPAPPSSSYKSFKINGKVYAATSDDEFSYFYSGIKLSKNYLTINNPPVASSVVIVDPTLARVGQTLTGDYEISDPDGDEIDTPIFRWLSSTIETGTYTAISGATGNTYTVQSADANKYIKFEVTPIAKTGELQGAPKLSDATPKVTGAPIIEIDPSTLNIYEASANNGSLGDAYVKITCTNTSFKSSITNSAITISKDLDGLSKGSVTWISANEIRLGFSGAAVNHEYAAKIDTIRITINKDQLEGVENNLTTQNGFNINFTNNPPTNLALDSVGNNYVKITWDKPAGLLTSGSGLDYFNILRNETNIGSIYLDKGKGTYYYTDNTVTNGTQYRYKVQAVYTAGTNETSTELRGTPLAITAYSFSTPPATGTIDHTNKTIKVAVPNGTDRNALIANFTAPGAVVKVGTATQTSGSTSNNFTNPVTYTLTTNNDASTCSYVVTVNEKLATPSPSVVGSNITTSSIKIHWDTITGADRYGVDVSENNSFPPGSFQHKEVSANFCIMNGLKAGTKYYYRVQAIAEDQYFNSDYSSVYDTTTDALIPGAGSTEIDSSYETTINVGEYVYGQETVTPTVKVHPAEFSPSENDIITVTMSYGTTPEGLQYNLAFENPTIGNGTFILSYSGLSYDPTDVGYRLNGGALHSVGGDGINTTDKIVIFTMSGLGKGSKAAYELQIVLNDESGQTLPVVLTSFTATQMVDGKVRVDWVTQSETNLSGFRVLRNTVAEISTAMAVSPLIEATNTSATVVYSFMDSEVPGNGIYYYWLQIEDLDGGISYSAVYTVQVTTGGVTNPIIPKITALLNPFPNPFNPDVTIPFDLAVDGNVTLKIYNLKGQLIKNLLNENCKANSYRILWDGKDNEGHTVSTGTYIIRMNAPNYQASHKISLIK